MSEAELMAVFVPKFLSVLDDTETFILALNAAGAPSSGRPRKPLLSAVRAERELLDANPRARAGLGSARARHVYMEPKQRRRLG